MYLKASVCISHTRTGLITHTLTWNIECLTKRKENKNSIDAFPSWTHSQVECVLRQSLYYILIKLIRLFCLLWGRVQLWSSTSFELIEADKKFSSSLQAPLICFCFQLLSHYYSTLSSFFLYSILSVPFLFFDDSARRPQSILHGAEIKRITKER